MSHHTHPTAKYPGLLEQAVELRARSASSAAGLRRSFTLAESIVTALVARGATYRQAAKVYGATVKTVSFHAHQAAAKVIDGAQGDRELAELEALPPKVRLLVWARRAPPSIPK